MIISDVIDTLLSLLSLHYDSPVGPIGLDSLEGVQEPTTLTAGSARAEEARHADR